MEAAVSSCSFSDTVGEEGAADGERVHQINDKKRIYLYIYVYTRDDADGPAYSFNILLRR